MLCSADFLSSRALLVDLSPTALNADEEVQTGDIVYISNRGMVSSHCAHRTIAVPLKVLTMA